MVDVRIRPDLVVREVAQRHGHAEAEDFPDHPTISIGYFSALVWLAEPDVDLAAIVITGRRLGRELSECVADAANVLVDAFIAIGGRHRILAAPPRDEHLAGTERQHPSIEIAAPVFACDVITEGVRQQRDHARDMLLYDALVVLRKIRSCQ